MNLYNPAVYRVADIVSTYTYRVGLVEFNYAYATAIGLFMNVIAFIMLATTNWVARRVDADSRSGSIPMVKRIGTFEVTLYVFLLLVAFHHAVSVLGALRTVFHGTPGG